MFITKSKCLLSDGGLIVSWVMLRDNCVRLALVYPGELYIITQAVLLLDSGRFNLQAKTGYMSRNGKLDLVCICLLYAAWDGYFHRNL